MINLLTANVNPKSGRYNLDKITVLLKAQIANSYDVGWLPKDILLLTNFDFEFAGIKAETIEFNPRCLTGSKMYAVRHALRRDVVVWAHDLDAWQNVWFDCPEMLDVAAATYDGRKYNGGSIFWRPESVDLVKKIIRMIDKEEATYEENVLNRVFKKHKARVTKLNFDYNVGCSNYRERWGKGDKPIKVAHFHPYNRIAWETHALDRCQLGAKGITNRLEVILRDYYTLATELKTTQEVIAV